MILGNKNQNNIININHRAELNRKASGDITFKKNNAADKIAYTFTNIIIILISRRLIK
jgi:hypothetical protein